MSGVGLRLRQLVPQIERQHPFETPASGDEILTCFIDRGKQAENGGLSRFIPKLDVMFRGVVQTALGLDEVALVEEAFSELTIGHGESFFIADDTVMIERQFERCDGLLLLTAAGLLQREVVVENAEGTVVLQLTQEIEGFQIVGPGFLRTSGADVEVAKVDQCVGDGPAIPFRPLYVEDLAITLFRSVEIVHERASVPEIAQGVGEFPQVVDGAVIGHCRFPGCASMDQVAPMEKNPRPMFMVI